MSQTEAEKFFQDESRIVATYTVNLATLKSFNSEIGVALKNISEPIIPAAVKDSLIKAISSAENGQATEEEKAILSANSCRWEYGPCGSCYNSNSYYAYRYSCDGGAWQYGCGGCV